MCHNSSADSAQSWLKTVAYPDECDAIPSSVIKHALRLVVRVTRKSRETHGAFDAVSLNRQAL